MAGYRETFGSNVDFAYQGGVRDIDSQVRRSISQGSGAMNFVRQLNKDASQASGRIKDLSTDITTLQQQMAQVQPGSTQWLSWNKQLISAQKNLKAVKREFSGMPFDAMEKGLGKVVKGLISLNTSILGIAFDFLIGSIKRVYELQERWTKAIGGFNMRIGGMTSGLKGATKAATSWSSTIRGLTDGDIQEGIEMFADFTEGIGEVIEKGDQFEKFGLQLARGFNLGGQGAGQLSKVMKVIGDSGDDAAETMKSMVKAANEAKVPVNIVAKDVLESSKYMARFGKEGQKTFVEGAAWVRKYKITMDQLRASVEGMDMFDEAAKTASKLNVAFGTMINSMDQMLEDDPAKRLDMIRQQMLAQGMTYDKLTPKQRRYFSETLKLTEDQTAALLDSRNANESYTDFLAKAEKKKKQELSAQQMMQKQLQATAQTMYAFGAAFDRVTVAIAKAIRPLLEVLGLAKRGGKDFTSFGQVMESITDTVVKFFESLAGNDRWMDFMKELGKDLQRAGSGLKEFVLSGRAADWVGRLASGMKEFYTTVRDLAIKAVPMMQPLVKVILFLSQHIEKLAMLWGGMKAMNFAKSLGIGGLGGGAVGKAGMGMAAGGIAGGLLGGTGAMAGGLIGGIAGPVAGIAGAGVGKLIEKLWTRYDEATEAEKSRAQLEYAIKMETEAHEAQTKTISSMEMAQRAQQTERVDWAKRLRELDAEAHRSKKGEIELTEADVQALKDRSSEMTGLSNNTKATAKALEEVFKPGGAAHVSADALDVLQKAAGQASEKMESLAEQSESLEKAHEAELMRSNIGKMETAAKLTADLDEAKAKRERAKYEQMGGGINLGFRYKGFTSNDVMRQGLEGKGPWMKMTKDEQERIRQGAIVEGIEAKVIEDKKKLVSLQSTHEEELYRLQLRQLLMQGSDFAAFAGSPAEQGLSPDQVLDEWLANPKNRDAIVSEYGSTVYEAATKKGIIPREFAGHYVATRLPAGGGAATTNYATTGGAGGAAVVKHEHEIVIKDDNGKTLARKHLQAGGTN